jgi:hypothetical protein
MLAKLFRALLGTILIVIGLLLALIGLAGAVTDQEVTVNADLRNKAAHGQWNEFTDDQVLRMLGSVRSFMEKHLT